MVTLSKASKVVKYNKITKTTAKTAKTIKAEKAARSANKAANAARASSRKANRAAMKAVSKAKQLNKPIMTAEINLSANAAKKAAKAAYRAAAKADRAAIAANANEASKAAQEARSAKYDAKKAAKAAIEAILHYETVEESAETAKYAEKAAEHAKIPKYKKYKNLEKQLQNSQLWINQLKEIYIVQTNQFGKKKSLSAFEAAKPLLCERFKTHIKEKKAQILLKTKKGRPPKDFDYPAFFDALFFVVDNGNKEESLKTSHPAIAGSFKRFKRYFIQSEILRELLAELDKIKGPYVPNQYIIDRPLAKSPDGNENTGTGTGTLRIGEEVALKELLFAMPVDMSTFTIFVRQINQKMVA
jgi:hypothetical protein